MLSGATPQRRTSLASVGLKRSSTNRHCRVVERFSNSLGRPRTSFPGRASISDCHRVRVREHVRRGFLVQEPLLSPTPDCIRRYGFSVSTLRATELQSTVSRRRERIDRGRAGSVTRAMVPDQLRKPATVHREACSPGSTPRRRPIDNRYERGATPFGRLSCARRAHAAREAPSIEHQAPASGAQFITMRSEISSSRSSKR